MDSIRSRTIIVALITLFSFYILVPTLVYFNLPPDKRNDKEMLKSKLPWGFGETHISLGLDLQGGVQLVLGVRLDQAVDNKLARIGTELTNWAADNKIEVKTAFVPRNVSSRLRIELGENADINKFNEEFRKKFGQLALKERSGKTLDYEFQQDQIKLIKDSALEQAERVVRNRVDKWGVTEPLIQRRADGSILASLPGFKDPERAKELLGRTAILKLKMVDDDFKGFDAIAGTLPPNITAKRTGSSTVLISEDKNAIIELTKNLIPTDRELLFEEEKLAGDKKVRYTSYVVFAATELDGQDVLDADSIMDTEGVVQQPAVSLRFTDIGAKRFEKVTEANVGKRMAIILDNTVESAPVIQTKIAGGHARITLGSGGYNEKMEESRQLSLVLKSGALPATIEILEQRQVGAHLGPELASQGIKGTLWGVVLIFGFMIGYYRRPGIIACAALILNGIYVLACMAMFGFALTLPGIAGFVLGLGVAVDANVLINERIRQELRENKPALKALTAGFKKVFWTVFDSHVTTMLAAFILLQTNTSGPIRGFAVTLIIGLIVSLYTSLYCSHLFFDIMISRNPNNPLLWLGGPRAKKTHEYHFNFLRWDKYATAISAVVVVAIITSGSLKGFNWAVDFVGGTEVEISFGKPIPVSQLRSTFKDMGLAEVSIQSMKDGEKEFLLRFDKAAIHSLKEKLKKDGQTAAGEEGGRINPEEGGAQLHSLQEMILKDFSAFEPKIVRVDYVGPQIGSELRSQGFMSLLYAILGIMVYMALRFDLRFGTGAILKLVPDMCVMLGFYLIFWRSFDLTSIAALLTGIGYSVNDVIVVFDRIRENTELHPGRPFKENINISLNETLSRTINTSLVTSLSLVGLMVFGVGSIWNFATAMCIGVLCATLTSNLVGSSYLLWFDVIIKKFSNLTATKKLA
ncbi:MAG: protein translocase subunit SecD [Oligoflexales bacterium]|nr:protein translocase subunit SecD [Oligoflexales bacterium]